ncbi:MAG: hypothetical protein GEV11_09410 [Streptosporangiales bacterium]|nr:hypothetical protein [Streptosporangiales bacterium]
MSISILLIPAALAAGAAVRAALAEGDAPEHAVTVRSRMRHRHLLAEALTAQEAEVTERGDALVAAWQGVTVAFTPHPSGAMMAHVEGSGYDLARAQELILAVDAAYAEIVQRELCRRVRERAGSVGMVVESEQVNVDRSVTLVLAEGR